ncbi:diguanylate cyclase [Andreprevotia chitinilytica]|uniref:diguanylate cyclase n=1 Tax=Andreprevotia chitinilytica TaxID=396808 RepID=UPI0005592B15|nr:diguanylate cyclase [Andreprevotia chitinilytica]
MPAPDAFEALLTRASEALARREPQEALRNAIAAETHTRRTGSPSERLNALSLKAAAEDQLGQNEASITTLHEALVLATTRHLPTDRLRVLSNLADRLYTVGRYREALAYWVECIELAMELGDIAAYVRAFAFIGGIFDAAGDRERALHHHERALAYSSALVDAELYINIRLFLAADYVYLGRYHEALEILDEADRMISAQGIDILQAETCLYRGQSLIMLGQVEAGMVCLREGTRAAQITHHAWAHVMCLMRLGQAHWRSGDGQHAEQVLRSARALAEESQIRLQLCEVLDTLAAVYEATQRPREALAALRASHTVEAELMRHTPLLALDKAALKRLDKLDTRLKLELSRQENLRLKEAQTSQDKLLHRLHIEAYEDALTGLANRRWLDGQLASRLTNWQGDPPCSLLVLDIDHFKAINDDFSHLVGDAVLAQVSELLRQTCRGQDTPVRFGGEEFLVLLEGLRLVEAWPVAERIRQRVERHDWSPLLGKRGLTLSAGVSEATLGDTPASLIARADEALYRAKGLGRNRVELSVTPDSL